VKKISFKKGVFFVLFFRHLLAYNGPNSHNGGFIIMTKNSVRDTVPVHAKWKLEDLFPTHEHWEKEFNELSSKLPSFSAYEGNLSSNSDILFQCLKADEELSLSLERLYVYASMRKDEDTTHTFHQGLMERVTSLYSQVSGVLSFIQPEILSMNESILEQFLQEKKELQHYKKHLDSILREKAHILSKEQEEILSQMGEITSAPRTIFGMIDNADMKFPTITDEKGNEVTLTHGNYFTFMEYPIQEVRKRAFQAYYSAYINQKNTIAATLSANVKKNVKYAKIRKFPSALEKSLFADNVPLSVYENLLSTVKSHLKPMHKYLTLRKELLNVEELHMYDIYTPLISEVNKTISYDEAYETMKKGLSPLGSEYIQLLEQAKTDGWIDVYENEGKRSGAYCSGAYGTHPYVLLNHKDNLNSMFTLAHEMGHAMHSYYSDTNNPYLYAQYTIFVAEVASTVNEVLLMHHLLQTTTDAKTKLYLLNYFLEQFRGTVFRQTMFAEFEKLTHEKAEKNEPLTVDVFNEIYGSLNQLYYGEGVVQDEEIQYEWMRIPHFYNSFYVYKYATGFSAAIAIAKAILEEGQPAVDRYMEFLKSGGRDYPIELLKKAGVDMSDSMPVENALSYFSTLVDEFETLVNETKKDA
jgi:oligoendopeptidase F